MAADRSEDQDERAPRKRVGRYLEMRVVCAWCGAVLTDAAGPVSHGICDSCSLTMERAWHRRGTVRPVVRRTAVGRTLPLPGFGPAGVAHSA